MPRPSSASTSTIVEQRMFSPPNDISTYRDLLLFEERLKTNAASLRRRKSRYQLFLGILLLIITILLSDVLLHTSFLGIPLNCVLQYFAPKYGPITIHPYIVSALLLISITTLVLFFASGMYSDKIGYANRYVPHANRALRSFNLYLNVRTQPHRSRFNPLSYFGRTEDPSTSEMQAPISRASSPRRGSTISNIPPTSNPRGELIFSSRVDPSFREGYERYRAAFERKREIQRRSIQNQKAWFQWIPWRKQINPSGQVPPPPRIRLHSASSHSDDTSNTVSRTLRSTPPSSRRTSPAPEEGIMTRSRRSNRSKSPSLSPLSS